MMDNNFPSPRNVDDAVAATLAAAVDAAAVEITADTTTRITANGTAAAASSAAAANNNNNKRLDLQRVGHFGRQRELNVLREYLDRAQRQQQQATATTTTTGATRTVAAAAAANSSSSSSSSSSSQGGILIEAKSGVGKTALLEVFVNEVRDRSNNNNNESPEGSSSSSSSGSCVVCCFGKFEERTAAVSEPFGTIRTAMWTLFEHLKSENANGIWSQRITEALGMDLVLIEEIIPDLRSLFVREADNNDNHENHHRGPSNSSQHIEDDSSTASSIDFDAFGDMSDKEWRFERFRLALRSLLRCVRTHHTVVLILDDVHWADHDSISLIRTLLEDDTAAETNRRFLFVGATRPIQDYKATLVDNLTKDLPDSKLKTFPLKPFNVENIASLLAEILERSEEEPGLHTLAEIIYAKTGGNAFVVIQFLRLLDEKNLIFYSEAESRWLWDGSRIDSEAIMSDNVTQVIADRLENVDRRRRSALMMAASFGASQFDLTTIVHAMAVLDKSDSHDDGDCGENNITIRMPDNDNSNNYADPCLVMENSRSLRQVLEQTAEDGLVEEVSPGRFRFTHDRIREGAYSLLPEGGERAEMHLKIGRQLRIWMDKEEELGIVGSSMSEEALLLNATQQLNLGADLITDTWEKLDLADLNYQAAELTAKKASFYPSMEYLQAGISCIGDNGWERHYATTLKLTVALTRMQYCCGLFDECIKSADSVVANAELFSDKQPVLHTKIFCLLQQEHQKEAVSLLLDILDSLGEPFPRRFLMFHALRGYLKSKRLLKNLSNEDILAIKAAKDSGLRDIVSFVERLAELSYLGGNPAYMLLSTFRMTQIFIEKGDFPLSGWSFGTWGWFRSQMGSFDEGMRYGRLSLRIFEKNGRISGVSKEGVRMKFLFFYFIAHWRLPINDGIEPIKSALNQVYEMGALDYYHMGAYTLYRTQFACGEPLSALVHDCIKYSESLLDYKHKLIWNINAPLHQAALNFMGRSTDPSILIGEHINIEECLLEWKKSGNKMALFQSQLFGMMVAYYFHNYELAEQHAKKLRKDLYEDGPEILVPLRLFYTCLTYVARFRTNRKCAYKQNIRKIVKQFHKWVEDGAINCIHMDLILRAEYHSASSTSSKFSIMEAYNKAISSADDSGMRQHKALANELAGSYLYGKSDPSAARPYLEKALDLYREWEAFAKVKDIETRYNHIFGAR